MAHPKNPNTLLTQIQQTRAASAALGMAAVELPAGPLAMEEGEWAYFPMGALICLGPPHAAQALAVLGSRACVFPMPPEAGVWQAHVMVPGWVCRVDWRPVREDPQRYAAWLWATTEATQALMGQMGQWAFCLQHHTPAQALASWLLHCAEQSASSDFQLHLSAMPQPMRHALQRWQADAIGPLRESGFEVVDGVVQALDPLRLRSLACTCHQRMPGHQA